ncbi:MAG: hypothetical protein KUG79_15265 [Pseudomonadales bacterium]|nr:hypothetical protein [Pseudomonadales bacterium]
MNIGDVTNGLAVDATTLALNSNITVAGAVDFEGVLLTSLNANVEIDNTQGNNKKIFLESINGAFDLSLKGDNDSVITFNEVNVGTLAVTGGNVSLNNDLIVAGEVNLSGAGGIALVDDVTINNTTGSNAAILLAPVTGANTLTLNGDTSSGITLAGTDVQTLQLVSGGTLTLNGVIQTETAQDYTAIGPIILGSDVQLIADLAGAKANITFDGANIITGANDLTITGSVINLFQVGGGGSNPSSVTINADSNLTLNSNITTTNGINLNADVVLAQDSALTLSSGSGSIEVSGTVNGITGFGAESLTLDAGASNISLLGAVSGAGGVVDATGLTTVTITNGDNVTFNALNVSGDFATTNALTGFQSNGLLTAGSIAIEADNFVIDAGIFVNGDVDLMSTFGESTIQINNNNVSLFGTLTLDVMSAVDVNVAVETFGDLIIKNADNVNISATAGATLAAIGGVSIVEGVANITLDGAGDVTIAQSSNAASIMLADVSNNGNTTGLVLNAEGSIFVKNIDVDGDLSIALVGVTTEEILTIDGAATARSIVISGTDDNNILNIEGNLTALNGGIQVRQVADLRLKTGITVASVGGDINLSADVSDTSVVGSDSTVVIQTIDTDNDISLGAISVEGDNNTVSLLSSGSIDLTGGLSLGPATALEIGTALEIQIDTDIDGVEDLFFRDALTARELVISAGLSGTPNDRVEISDNISVTNGLAISQLGTIRIKAGKNILAQAGSVDLNTNIGGISLEGLGQVLITQAGAGDVLLAGITKLVDGQRTDLSVVADGSITTSTIDLNNAANDGDVSLHVDSDDAGDTGLLTIGGEIDNVNNVTLSATAVRNTDIIDINADITAGGLLTVGEVNQILIDASAARAISAVGGNLDLSDATEIVLDSGNSLVSLTAELDGDVNLAPVRSAFGSGGATTLVVDSASLAISAEGAVQLNGVDLNASSTKGRLDVSFDVNNNLVAVTLSSDGEIDNISSLNFEGSSAGDDVIDINSAITTSGVAGISIESANRLQLDGASLSAVDGTLSLDDSIAKIVLDGADIALSTTGQGNDIRLTAIEDEGAVNNLLIASSGTVVTTGDISVGVDLDLEVDDNSTLTLGQNLTAGGQITLTGGLGVNQSAGVLSAGQLFLNGQATAYNLAQTGNNVSALAGDTGSLIYTNANALSIALIESTSGVKANTGDVSLTTVTGNLTLTDQIIATSGDVNLIVGAGLLGSASIGVDIQANKLTVDATNGIGDSNVLETSVDIINLDNAASGAINVRNSASVTIAKANQAGTGDIDISTVTGNLTVDNVSFASDTVIVQTTSSNAIQLTATSGDIVINDSIQTAAGNVTMQSGDGAIMMSDGAVVNSTLGDVVVNANGDIEISSIQAVGTGAKITLDSVAGLIKDGGSTDDDLVTEILQVTDATQFGETGDLLELDVTTANISVDGVIALDAVGTGGLMLTANSNVAGDIVIAANEDLTLTSIATASGAISVTATSAKIDAVRVQANGTTDADDIALTTIISGNINLGQLITGLNGDVSLASAGEILNITDSANVEISTDMLTVTNAVQFGTTLDKIDLNASSAEILVAGIVGLDAVGGGGLSLTAESTQVGDITVFSTTEPLTLTSIRTNSGLVDVDANAAIVAIEVVANNGNINIDSLTDGIQIGRLATNTDIFLSADAEIENLTVDEGVTDILATNLMVSRGATFGATEFLDLDVTSAAIIEIASSVKVNAVGSDSVALSVKTRGAGSIDIMGTQDLKLDDVSTFSGQISVVGIGADIAALRVSAGGGASDDGINIKTESFGSISLDTLSAAGAGIVVLDSADQIANVANDSRVDIVAAGLIVENSSRFGETTNRIDVDVANINITSKGDVGVDAVGSTGIVALDLTSTILGDITVTGAGEDLLLNSVVVASGFIDIDAVNLISATGLDASGNIELNSTGGEITLDGLISGADILVESAGNLTSATSVSAIGNVNLNSTGAAITLAGLVSGVDLAVTSVGNLISTNSVSASGDININSTGGEITLAGLVSGVDIAVTSAGNLTSTNAVNAAGDISMNTISGAIMLNSLIADFDISLQAAGTIENSVADAEVDIQAAKLNVVDGTSFGALDSFQVDLDTADIIASGTAQLDSLGNGGLSLDVALSSGSLNVASAEQINLGVINIAGSTTVSSSEDIVVAGVLNAGGKITLASSTNLIVESSGSIVTTEGSAGDIELLVDVDSTAESNLTINGLITSDGNILLHSTNADTPEQDQLSVNADITSTGELKIENFSSITLGESTNLEGSSITLTDNIGQLVLKGAGGNNTLTAVLGRVEIADVVSEQATLFISAASDVELASFDRNGTGSGSLTVQKAGNVAINASVDANIVSLQSATTGAVEFLGDVDANIINLNSESGSITFTGITDIFQLNTQANEYTVSFVGAETTVQNDVQFFNNPAGVGIVLGDEASDMLSFNGGLSSTLSSSSVQIFGALESLGNTLQIGDVALAGASSIVTNGAALNIKSIAGNSHQLDLNSGAAALRITGAIDNLTSFNVIAGGATFNGAIGTLDPGEISLINVNADDTFVFNGATRFTEIITQATDYSISLLGAVNEILSATVFLQNGGLLLGDAVDDTINFVNGVTYTNGLTTLAGTVMTSGDNGNVIFDNIQLEDTASINTSAVTAGNITLNNITGSDENLNLAAGDDGNILVSGDINGVSTLTVVDSNTVTFDGRVGQQVEGAITITDTTDSVFFNRSTRLTTFSTSEENFEVVFNGTSNQISELVTFNNSGKVFLGDDDKDQIAFNGGATFGSTVVVDGSITTDGDDLVFQALTVVDAKTISIVSAGGTVTFNGLVSGSEGEVETLIVDASNDSLLGGDIIFQDNITVDNVTLVGEDISVNNGLEINEVLTVDATDVVFSTGEIIAKGGFSAINEIGNVTLAVNLTTESAAVDINGNLTIAEGKNVVIDTVGIDVLAGQDSVVGGDFTASGFIKGNILSSEASESLEINAGGGAVIFGREGDGGAGSINGEFGIGIGNVTGLTDLSITSSGSILFSEVDISGELFVVSESEISQRDNTEIRSGSLATIVGRTLEFGRFSAGALELTATGNATFDFQESFVVSGTVAGNLDLTSSGAISFNTLPNEEGLARELTVAGTSKFKAQSLILDADGSSLGGTITLGGDVILDIANDVVIRNSVTASLEGFVGGNLSLIATTGEIKNSNALEVGGLASFISNAGDITLETSSNLFGSLNLETTGSISITEGIDSTDAEGTILTGVIGESFTLVSSAGDVKQVEGALFNVAGLADFEIDGDLTLGVLAASEFLAGKLRVNGANANVTIVESSEDGLVLGELQVRSLDIVASDNIISEIDVDISVANETQFDAGVGNVDISLSNNTFGDVSLTGNSIFITESESLRLSEVNAASDFEAVAEGGITGGAIVVGGSASFTANNDGDITLISASNSIGDLTIQTAQDVRLNSLGDLTLHQVTVRAFELDVGGTLTQAEDATIVNVEELFDLTVLGDIELTATGNQFGSLEIKAGDIDSVGIEVGGNVSINEINATNLGKVDVNAFALISGGAITQKADTGIDVMLEASFNAGDNAITLRSEDTNKFGLLTLTGGNVKINEAAATSLGKVAATLLDVVSLGGIDGDEVIAVSGLANFSAGANVNLTNSGNSFETLKLSGSDLIVNITGSVQLDDLSGESLVLSTSQGDFISESGAQIAISGLASLSTDDGDITLGAAQNNDVSFGAISLDGNNITFIDSGSTFIRKLNATGNATIKANGAGSTISEESSAEINVSQLLTLEAVEDINLDEGSHSFNRISVKSTAGAVRLTDNTATILTSLLVTNDFELNSGGNILNEGGIDISGDSKFVAVGNITLDGADNTFDGELTLDGQQVNLTASGAILLDGLEAAGIRLQSTGGSIADTSNGTINVEGLAAFETTENITLTGNTVNLAAVSLVGDRVEVIQTNDANIQSTNAQNLLFTSSGSINSSGAIVVAMDTSFVAGNASQINIENSSNEISRLAVQGGVVRIISSEAVELNRVDVNALDLMAGGAITDGAGEIEILTLAGFTANNAADIELGNAVGNALDDRVSIGSIDFQAETISLVQSSESIVIEGLSAVGDLTLESRNGNIDSNADAVITVQTGDVNLTVDDNQGVINFVANGGLGDLSLVGFDVTVEQEGIVNLQNVDARNLTVKSNGFDVSNVINANINVSGTATFDTRNIIVVGTESGRGNVTLGASGVSNIGALNIIAENATITDSASTSVVLAGLDITNDFTLAVLAGGVSNALNAIADDFRVANRATITVGDNSGSNDQNIDLRASFGAIDMQAAELNLSLLGDSTISRIEADTLFVDTNNSGDLTVEGLGTLKVAASANLQANNVTFSVDSINEFGSLNIKATDIENGTVNIQASLIAGENALNRGAFEILANNILIGTEAQPGVPVSIRTAGQILTLSGIDSALAANASNGTVQLAGDVVLDTTDIETPNQGAELLLLAENDRLIGRQAAAGQATLTLDAGDANITLGNFDPVSRLNSLTVSSANELLLNDVFVAGNTVEITTKGNITAVGIIEDTDGDIRLNTSGGNILLGKRVTANAGSLTFESEAGTFIANGDLLARDGLNIISAGDVAFLGNTTVLDGGSNIVTTAGTFVTNTETVMDLGGALTVNAVGQIILGSNVAAAGLVKLTSTEGAIDAASISTGTEQQGFNLELLAGDNINLSALDVGGSASIITVDGRLNFTDNVTTGGSFVAVSQSAFEEGFDPIGFDQAKDTIIKSGGDLTIFSQQGMNIASVEADEDVVLVISEPDKQTGVTLSFARVNDAISFGDNVSPADVQSNNGSIAFISNLANVGGADVGQSFVQDAADGIFYGLANGQFFSDDIGASRVLTTAPSSIATTGDESFLSVVLAGVDNQIGAALGPDSLSLEAQIEASGNLVIAINTTGNAGQTAAASSSRSTAASQRDEDEDAAEIDEVAFQNLKNYDENPQGLLLPEDQQFAYDDEGNVYSMIMLRSDRGSYERFPLYKIDLELESTSEMAAVRFGNSLGPILSAVEPYVDNADNGDQAD